MTAPRITGDLLEMLQNPIAYQSVLKDEIERRKMALQIQKSRDLADLLKGSLYLFVQHAWPVLFPSRPFIKSKVTQAICEHTEALLLRKIQYLLMTVPPGTGKSAVFSILAPAWMWARDPILGDDGLPFGGPSWRSIYASYGQDISTTNSILCRDLMRSEWYQEVFRPEWRFARDQDEKTYYFNTAKGFRMSTSVGGRGTGYRASIVGIDDPLNAKEQNSDAVLDECIHWFDNVIFNRRIDMQRDGIGIIMQRLHERDLAGHVLSQGGWEHLLITMEYDSSRSKVTSLGWKDWRKTDGELMFPELFSQSVVEVLKKKDSWAGQYQQEPAPATGAVFKKHWWRFYRRPEDPAGLGPVREKDENGEIVAHPLVPLPPAGQDFMSWDLAFKANATSDYVCGGVIRRSGANFYVLTLDKRKLDFPQTCEAVRNMSNAWPTATAKLIEEKANGPALIATLSGSVSGLIPVNPKDSKLGRAHASAPLVKAGNVFLPHPDVAPWVRGFIESLAMFPNGAHDDDVDMLTQALTYSDRRVFSVEKSTTLVNPFTVPRDWMKGVGVFCGPRATGAVWVAREPGQNGKYYVYDEYSRVGVDFSVHAAEIKRRSGDLPVMLDCALPPDLPQFVAAYRKAGLNVNSSPGEVEPMTSQIEGALASGQLKVFKSAPGTNAELAHWQEEYSLMSRNSTTGKIDRVDDYVVLGAMRALWFQKERMTGPVRLAAPLPRLGGSMGWAR